MQGQNPVRSASALCLSTPRLPRCPSLPAPVNAIPPVPKPPGAARPFSFHRLLGAPAPRKAGETRRIGVGKEVRDPPRRRGLGWGWGGGEGTGVGSAVPSAGAGDKGLSDRHYCLRAAGLRGPRVAPGWSGTVAGSNLLVVSRRDLCSCQAAFTATSELRPRAALLPRPSVNGAKEKGKQPKVPPLSLRVL